MVAATRSKYKCSFTIAFMYKGFPGSSFAAELGSFSCGLVMRLGDLASHCSRVEGS